MTFLLYKTKLESWYYMNKEAKKILILSSLVWIVSNLLHPVTPTHFTNLNLPDHVFGTSYAAMVFSMFLTAPIWGSIGDKGNRIKVLSIVTFLYGIFQIGLGLVTTLTGVIIMRSLAGMVSSGFHVGLMSALVDVSEPDKRKLNMTNYAAIMSVSGSIGFLLGGIIGYLPTIWVFIIQGMCMILISLGIKLFIKETNPQVKEDTSKKTVFIWDLLRDAKKSKEVFSFWILIFLGITFFVGIAYSGNNNAFNYYLKAELNMKPIVNGVWKALTGVLGLIANLTINVWLINKTNIKKSIVGLLFLSTAFGFLVFIYNDLYPFLIFNLIFFTLYTIQVPILQGFAVEGQFKDVGFMAGLYNAVKSLGEMLGSTIAGFSYDYNSKLPFLIGTMAFGIALVLSLINYFKNEIDKVVE